MTPDQQDRADDIERDRKETAAMDFIEQHAKLAAYAVTGDTKHLEGNEMGLQVAIDQIDKIQRELDALESMGSWPIFLRGDHRINSARNELCYLRGLIVKQMQRLETK